MARIKNQTKSRKTKTKDLRLVIIQHWKLIALIVVAVLSAILFVVGRYLPSENRVKFLATMGPDIAPELSVQPQFKFDNGGRPYDSFFILYGRDNKLLKNQIEVQNFQFDVIGAAIDIYRIPLTIRDLDDTSPRIPLDDKDVLKLLPNYELVFSSKGRPDRFILEPSVVGEVWSGIGPGEIKYLSPIDGYGIFVNKQVVTTVSTPHKGTLNYHFEYPESQKKESPTVRVSTGIGPKGGEGETMKDVFTKDWSFFLLASADVILWDCLDEIQNPPEDMCKEKRQLFPPSISITSTFDHQRERDPLLIILKRPNSQPDEVLMSVAMLNSMLASEESNIVINALTDDPILTRWLPGPPIDKTNFVELETIGLPGTLSVGIKNYEVQEGDVVRIVTGQIK